MNIVYMEMCFIMCAKEFSTHCGGVAQSFFPAPVVGARSV